MQQLTIDGKAVDVRSGATLLEAAQLAGAAIPTLCYMKEIGVLSTCMVCLVKDLDTGRLLPACSAPARNGMAIDTSSEEVRMARRDVLRMLMAEHVGDCEAPCTRYCPASLDTPRMMRHAAARELDAAARVAARDLVFPATLGRICAAPCETGCRRGLYDRPLPIRALHGQLAEEHAGMAIAPEPLPPTGKAVAIAMSHPAGVGMATHRFPDYEGYVEGAQFPAVRRWVFERVGTFDEQLVRNQDDELNYRITLAGGKSYVSPRVRYVYYVRDSPRKLFRQYLQYSFWRIPVIRKHKRPTTPRQMAPPLFFLAMLVLLIVGLALRQPLVALALPAAYLGVLLLIGVSQIPKAGLKVALLVPVAIAIMHVAYAMGIVLGLFSAVFRPHTWDHSGSMATLSR